MWQSTTMNRKASLQGKGKLGKISLWLTESVWPYRVMESMLLTFHVLLAIVPETSFILSQAGTFIRGKASHLDILTEFWKQELIQHTLNFSSPFLWAASNKCLFCVLVTGVGRLTATWRPAHLSAFPHTKHVIRSLSLLILKVPI